MAQVRLSGRLQRKRGTKAEHEQSRGVSWLSKECLYAGDRRQTRPEGSKVRNKTKDWKRNKTPKGWRQ